MATEQSVCNSTGERSECIDIIDPCNIIPLCPYPNINGPTALTHLLTFNIMYHCIEAEIKMAGNMQNIFEIGTIFENCCYFYSNFAKICSKGPN